MTTQDNPVCGIIMPITAIPPDYTEAHWTDVRKIIERAIIKANMAPQAVWENQNNDVIHGKILKNIYENDVVVCDCSGRNPNVMLELGMRLTTKKPTVLISDKNTNLPFDTGVISHTMYSKSLAYNDIDTFIDELAKAIRSVYDAFEAGTYVSFVENFRFETVTPSTVTISADQFNSKLMADMATTLSQMDINIHKISLMQNILVPHITKLGDGLQRNASELIMESVERKQTRDDLHVGQRVFHQKFGAGSIMEIDGSKLEALFDNSGQKRVMDSFVTIIED
jgi:hypothetical protein